MFPGKLFLTFFLEYSTWIAVFLSGISRSLFLFDTDAGMFAPYSALVALKLKTSSFLNPQQNDNFSGQVQLSILDSSTSKVAI